MKRNRRSPDEPMRRGLELFNRKDYARALSEFDAALMLRPRWAKAHYFRGLALRSLGRLPESLRAVEKAARLDRSAADYRREASAIRESLADAKLLARVGALVERGEWARALSACRRPGKAWREFAAKIRSWRDAERTKIKRERAQSVSRRAEELLEKSARARERGELASALATLRGLPSHPRALRERASIEKELGRRADSLKSIARVARVDDSEDAALWAARTAVDEGEFRLGLRYLGLAARRAPGSAPTQAKLADLLLRHGELRPAAAEAAKALALDSSCAPARRVKGAALALEGKLSQALRELVAALKLEPEDREARVWLGEVLRRLGRPREALRELERAGAGRAHEERPAGALINAILAKRDLRQKAPAEAAALFLALPWRQLSMHDGANTREELERALGFLAGGRGMPNTMRWAPPWNRRSREMLHYNSRVRTIGLQAALRFGDAGRVLGEFDKLLKASPGEPYLNNSRGEVCLWLGRYAEAERCLRRELSANPELPWSRVGLCGVRAMRGDYKGALAQLDDARRLTGAAEAALAPWRGEVYRRQGRPADALAELAKANARMPFRPSLWLNDALARGDLGDRAGQRRILEKLARHAPEFLADAATEARCRWRPGARASDGEARRVLEKGLALMRGNRSSWMYTYVLGSGKIKLIRLSGVPASKIPQGYAGFRWMFA